MITVASWALMDDESRALHMGKRHGDASPESHRDMHRVPCDHEHEKTRTEVAAESETAPSREWTELELWEQGYSSTPEQAGQPLTREQRTLLNNPELGGWRNH